jgi:L,D-transpeptidase catalytic domain
MGRGRLIGVTAITLIAFAASSGGQVMASGTRSSALALGPPRAWGRTEIRSLDPLSAATARSSSPPDSGSPQPPRDQLLSNERTFTRWAYVADTTPIYRRPAASSPRVARLHWYTEDGFPEIYLLLRARWDTHGREWIQLRVPMRPNGHTGWVRRHDLGAFHLTHTQIVVNRAGLRMYLYDRGHRVWSAPVAVGKPSSPTPSGHFWIRERFKIEDTSSGYWPYAFGTSDYSTLTDWPGGGVVGIHGPYFEPWAIPGRVSHGCIRLRDSDDAWLAHHIGLGTPLRVL